jgi:hypothetical protein
MIRKATKPARRDSGRGTSRQTARLDQLIQEAIVDAYGDSEQATALYTMIEEHLAMPFTTTVLGSQVTVRRVDMTDDEQIVAVCALAKTRQRIPILDLPLPEPPPEGSEWIDAYRRWARRGR